MSEPIRIAQIVGKMGYGGVEAVIMNYYRHIDRSKIQFDFIVSKDSLLPNKHEIEKLGGRIFFVDGYLNFYKYAKSLLFIFNTQNYKIVHSHVNTLSIFPLFIARIKKIPVRIAHSHSTSGKGEFKRNMIKSFLRLFSRLFATNLFACSELAGKWLFGINAFDQKKITIINNAINVDKFIFNTYQRNKIRLELGINEKVVIGHVGRFVTQKNHEFLIEVFYELYKQNKNYILLLIGEGPLELKIKQKINLYGLNDYIKFLGVRVDVNLLMNAMDIFVLPSLYEGLPVVGIEAQSNGLLCLFADTMTKESKILNTTQFLSLNYTPAIWAEKIESINNSNYDRYYSHLKIKEVGYDIKESANKLTLTYLNLYEKVKKQFVK